MIAAEQGIVITYGGRPLPAADPAPGAPYAWARDEEVMIDDQRLLNAFVAIGYPRNHHGQGDEEDGLVERIRIAATGEDAVAWLSPSLIEPDEADEPIGPHMHAWAPRELTSTFRSKGNQALLFHGYVGRWGPMITSEPQPVRHPGQSLLVRVGFPFPIGHGHVGLWQVVEGAWTLTMLDSFDAFHGVDLDFARGRSPLVELLYHPGTDEVDWGRSVASWKVLRGYEMDLSAVTTERPRDSRDEAAWLAATMAQLRIVRA